MLTRLVPLLLAATVAAPLTAQAQVRSPAPAGSPLALVLNTEGSISTDDGNAVTGGALLSEGQSLRLETGAEVRFSLITSCKELTVEGPGGVTFQGGAAQLDGARLVQSEAAPGCVKNDHVVLSTASQVSAGAVVVRGSADKGRMSPRSGVITSDRRTLHWDGPLADGRDVLITITSGDTPDQVLLETDAAGGSFDVPPSLALVPGSSYAWTVEPAGLAPGPAIAGSFQIAEAPLATQLGELKSRARDAEGWLRVAFFCEVHMLETDAAEAYAQALARDPGADGAAQRLAELDLP